MWIGLYRRLRGLLHSGDVVRGDLPDEGALLHGVVARDGSEAVLAYVRLTTAPDAHPGLVRLPGLDPLRQYDVAVIRELGEPATVEAAGPGWWVEGVSLPGAVLGAVGLTMPVLAPASAWCCTCARAEQREQGRPRGVRPVAGRRPACRRGQCAGRP